MGYQHKAPRINVKFAEGHDYHGFEAVLRKLTLGEWLAITGIGDDVSVQHVGDQLMQMGDRLISWNLDDEDGNPIPATSEAVLEQDPDLMLAVLNAWIEGISGVSAPLDQSSPDGAQSLEASIPMDTLSSSLVS